jgi:biotin carboxyl carrier protein
MAEKFLVRLNDEDVELELRREDGATFVRREGEGDWSAVSLERVGDSGLYLLMVDNHPIEIYLERRRGGALVTIGRHQFDCDVGPWRPQTQRASVGVVPSGTMRIMAPMTGSIVETRGLPGDRVVVGQVLLIIESMKMNNELRAPAAGVIEAIPVSPGQRVKAGDLLIAIRADGG